MHCNCIREDSQRVLDHVDLSPLEGKDILITGASGLVGTCFLNTIMEAVARGIRVKQLNLVTRQALPSHLAFFEHVPWVKVWRGDLCDTRFIQTMDSADYIIHGAGYAQPKKFMRNADKTLWLNTGAVFHLLNRLKLDGSFLFISSTAVYSGLEKAVFTEEDVGNTNTTHPRACYIEGKKCGETICNAFRSKGISAKSVRLSYTYGPGSRPGDERALNSFIDQGLHGDIQLLDTGEDQRVYCYISDAIEQMWNVLLKGQEAIYNVGGHSVTTIYALAKMVGDALGVQVKVPSSSDGRIRGSAATEHIDLTRIETEFGKKDYVSLEYGVAKTIEWAKEQCK